MTVQCWVRDVELREFVRQRCGVETLTARHQLVKVTRNGMGDLFLEWEPKAAAPKGRRDRRSHV